MEALLLLSLFAVCVVISAWLQKPKETPKHVYKETALRYQPSPSLPDSQNVYSYTEKTVTTPKQLPGSKSVHRTDITGITVPEIITDQTKKESQIKKDKQTIVAEETPSKNVEMKMLEAGIKEKIKMLEDKKTQIEERYVSDRPGKIKTEEIPGNYMVRDEVKKAMKSSMNTTVTFYTLLFFALPYSFYYLICFFGLVHLFFSVNPVQIDNVIRNTGIKNQSFILEQVGINETTMNDGWFGKFEPYSIDNKTKYSYKSIIPWLEKQDVDEDWPLSIFYAYSLDETLRINNWWHNQGYPLHDKTTIQGIKNAYNSLGNTMNNRSGDRPSAGPTAETTPTSTPKNWYKRKPEPIPTPIPTEQATPIPTAETTPIPTAETTPIPTAETTPTQTEQATSEQTPTEQATSEPTSTVENPKPSLYSFGQTFYKQATSAANSLYEQAEYAYEQVDSALGGVPTADLERTQNEINR